MSVFDRYFELKSSKKPVKLIKEENAYLKRLKELNTKDEIKQELLNEMAPPSPMQYAQLRRPPEAKVAEQQVKIEAEHPGVLEVPEGKSVESLGIDHFNELIKKKGWPEISKAITNLNVWNKDKNPTLSSWANDMQDRCSTWVEMQRKAEGKDDLFS
jgi:hypothetical protein